MDTLSSMAGRSYQRMPTMTPQARADLEACIAAIKAADKALTDRRAELIDRLRYWHGQGIEPGEMADVVGMTRGYVSKRVHGRPINARSSTSSS